MVLPSEPAWISIASPLKSRITNPRMVEPSAVAPSVRPSAARSLPSSSTSGVPRNPSCVVASRITASVIVGSAEVGLMVTAPLPIEKFELWMPNDALVIALALRMNWRRLPWMVRLPATSSPSRVVLTALKLKPESTPVAFTPASTTRVMCSAVASADASSDTVALRPP